MEVSVWSLFIDKAQAELVKVATKHQQLTHGSFTTATQLLTKTWQRLVSTCVGRRLYHWLLHVNVCNVHNNIYIETPLHAESSLTAYCVATDTDTEQRKQTNEYAWIYKMDD